ncbi:uncharacterized protein LOC135682870 [Rhopilema esculentum]|uniref:uncharacterized protein LOC135682870 n=1 Tax=Rhopilema esculentum TaxID=499914 RepID=UPI0031D583E2
MKSRVEDHLNEIRQLAPKNYWRYCPSDQNPSDIASRGIKCTKIVENELWWLGPKFLRSSEATWPNVLSYDIAKKGMSNELNELKGTNKESVMALLVYTKSKPSLKLQDLIQCERYSSLQRLLRVTAYILRFIKNLKSKLNQDSIETKQMLSLDEIEKARELWINEVQSYIPQETDFEKSSNLLGLFYDDKGIIRCKGRIENADLPYETRFPILLPRKHHFTDLVIWESHIIVKHNGLRETLNEVRASFWIIKGRQKVKKIISKCVHCKKIEGRAYGTQVAPALPEFRVSDTYAFSKIGVDFAGPLYVKDIYAKDTNMNKCYIALFTCANSRAVHLELVPDLEGESFIRCLKRLIGRRGIPSLIVSDNGKTFKDAKVHSFIHSRRVQFEWKFNVPLASWWGGFFEICVRLVKRCLKKSLGNAKLTYEELETELIEIEGVLNSRPLTYVYNELGEVPLTPAHLFMGRRLLDRTSCGEEETGSEVLKLSKRSRYLASVIDKFRKSWKREYLTSLREFHNCGKQTTLGINIGDIVYVHESKLPRQRWRMAKVTKLLPGKDGVVRAVELLTSNSAKKHITIKRPIQKLYPIEIRSSSEVTEQDSEEPQITIVRDQDVPEIIVNKTC